MEHNWSISARVDLESSAFFCLTKRGLVLGNKAASRLTVFWQSVFRFC